MKAEAFAHYSDVAMTLLGLVLFVAVFTGAVIWTGLKANKKKYEKIARQPLNDGDPV